MRPLTDDELKLVFEKLAKYIGRDVEALITRVDDPHCFRVVKNRVYYISEAIMRLSTNVSRDNTVSVGTCFGKITHSGKFHLLVSCLDHLHQHAKARARARARARESRRSRERSPALRLPLG